MPPKREPAEIVPLPEGYLRDRTAKPSQTTVTTGRAGVDDDFGHNHEGAGDPHAHDWINGRRGGPRPLEARRLMLNTFHDENGLWVGQFEARISDLVSECPGAVSECFLVVDILDSTSPVASLSAWTQGLDDAGIAWTAVDGRVVIAPEAVPRLVAARKTFYGFDQVWLCSRMPRAGEIPAGRFTSDVAAFESGMPEPLHALAVQPWFVALLADGCGLNVATSSGRRAAAMGLVFLKR